MEDIPIVSEGWVTLLGAGAPRREDLETALAYAPLLIAADGAAVDAVRFGRTPDWVVGDMDSVDEDAVRHTPTERIIEVPEQDSTDFEKCLTRVAAPIILATGFTDARIDHTLAALSALVRHADRRCVLFDAHDVIFAAPPRLELGLEPGTRVSLFPMGSVHGWSTGLQWPIEGLHFAPNGRIGTSNRATGPVELAFSAPGMIVILPREALEAALAALAPG